MKIKNAKTRSIFKNTLYTLAMKIQGATELDLSLKNFLNDLKNDFDTKATSTLQVLMYPKWNVGHFVIGAM